MKVAGKQQPGLNAAVGESSEFPDEIVCNLLLLKWELSISFGSSLIFSQKWTLKQSFQTQFLNRPALTNPRVWMQLKILLGSVAQNIFLFHNIIVF